MAVLLVCMTSFASCDLGGHKKSTTQDAAVRRAAETQIRGRVLADMRSHANPVDGPPFRVQASCPTQSGSGARYTLTCQATGYERPKAIRDLSGVPASRSVASERWSAAIRNGKVSGLTRAPGKSIGRSMAEHYDLLCDGFSSSGDPVCH